MKKFVNILATSVAAIVYLVICCIPSFVAFAAFGNILFKWFYPLIGVEIGIISTIVGLLVLLPISCIVAMSMACGYQQLMAKWNKPFITVGKKVYE